jgi:hypothetical protein
MKFILSILILLIGFAGCQKTASLTREKTTIVKEVPPESQQKICIKDHSHYDNSFLEGLKEYNEPIKLIDDYIVTGIDTTYFPTDLILNKSTKFTATSEHGNYHLTVTRTNLTNLSYQLEVEDPAGIIMEKKSGTAILGSMFFLASEIDEDTGTGDAYGSSEYWDQNKECWLAIRIGFEKDPNGKQRAMMHYGCENKKNQALDLSNCPTLRTE